MVNTDNINIIPENKDNDSNHDGNIINPVANPAARAAGGVTNFNLRVEQNKIPEFFGKKGKDTLSATDFI
jgi:hypothetical protein